MTKIKVTVSNVEFANELIEFWKDKDVNLEINVKENTTAENSDVNEIKVGEKGKIQHAKSISKL